MQKETLVKGIAILSKAFPYREFDVDFLWQFFEQIDDADFETAILEIVTTVDEVKNIIPIVLRFSADAHKKKFNDSRKLTEDRWEAPPEEWLELKKKLGLKIK